MTRYPELDLDKAIQDYLDKKETVWTLKHKGYRLIGYFRKLGILRSYGEDITLQRFFKHGSVSVYDNPNYIAALKANYGVERPLQSPELVEKKMLTHLKKDGLEALLEPAKVLRKLKNMRRAKAKEAKEKAEQEKHASKNADET